MCLEVYWPGCFGRLVTMLVRLVCEKGKIVVACCLTCMRTVMDVRDAADVKVASCINVHTMMNIVENAMVLQQNLCTLFSFRNLAKKCVDTILKN